MASLRTHIESVVEIKVVMPIKVTTDEFVDLCLARGMKILEFVNSLELDDIEAVRKYAIGLPLE